MSSRLWSLSCCWLSALLAAQTEPLDAAAGRAVQTRMARDGIPGLSVAIAIGDRIAVAAGYGFADLENDVPARASTVYRLASLSKPITAVVAMICAEQGQLDLDADVHTLVPEWPAKEWPVTTRQLLGHLGGVRHYRGEPESTVPYPTQRAALARFAGDDLLHEPGSRFHYSTYGFNLAAAVVEAITAQPFSAVVAQRIAVPCEAATLQADIAARLIRGRAAGYVRVDGELQNSQLMDPSYKIGGGGLCASAEDVARFARALLAGRLVGAAALESMWTPQRTSAGAATGYGLGFAVGERFGRRVVSHGGAQARVSTALLLVPDAAVAVVVLCNLEGVRLASLAEQLADLALAAANSGR